ncbi:MAG: GAF domain-containing protein [Sebaldella sp.]|nr:GAF domain-containing protein [Sebaldella sp.]
MEYISLLKSYKALIEKEDDFIALLANTSAFIYNMINDLNWAGFYLLKEDDLVLGPFQGKPACTRIKNGSGVCGTALKERETIIVDDVHEFKGHIACDGASNSEIVVPIFRNGIIIGVLDIDSPKFSRFKDEEKQFFEELVWVLEGKIQ